MRLRVCARVSVTMEVRVKVQSACIRRIQKNVAERKLNVRGFGVGLLLGLVFGLATTLKLQLTVNARVRCSRVRVKVRVRVRIRVVIRATVTCDALLRFGLRQQQQVHAKLRVTRAHKHMCARTRKHTYIHK